MKCTSFTSARECNVQQWAFKLNNVPAAAEIWHLKDHKVN
jgi:hypothetical protein